MCVPIPMITWNFILHAYLSNKHTFHVHQWYCKHNITKYIYCIFSLALMAFTQYWTVSYEVRFQYLTEVQMKMTVFWHVVPCSPVENEHFRGAYHLHQQDPDVGGSKHLWNIGQFVPDCMAQHPRKQSLVPVAKQSEVQALIVWTLRPWVQISLKVWMFVLVYSSSSITCHPIIDAI
jgi:hypothetical protein